MSVVREELPILMSTDRALNSLQAGMIVVSVDPFFESQQLLIGNSCRRSNQGYLFHRAEISRSISIT